MARNHLEKFKAKFGSRVECALYSASETMQAEGDSRLPLYIAHLL